MQSERQPAVPNISSVLREEMRNALRDAQRNGFASSAPRTIVHNFLGTVPGWDGGPERLLITFKALLSDAADDARIPLGRDRATLLERFVTLCIEEMYEIAFRPAVGDGDRRGKNIGVSVSTNREAPDARP